jgi:hypothetical protein
MVRSIRITVLLWKLEAVTAATDHCGSRANSNISRKAVFEYLQRVGYHAHVSCLLTKSCIPALVSRPTTGICKPL